MHNFCGGRSDLFNSGGGGQKGGDEYFQNSGGSWLKGGYKIKGGFGPWMKLWWLEAGVVRGWGG